MAFYANLQGEIDGVDISVIANSSKDWEEYIRKLELEFDPDNQKQQENLSGAYKILELVYQDEKLELLKSIQNGNRSEAS